MRTDIKEPPPGVVVLYNRSERLIKGQAHDLLAEQGVITCAQAVAEALLTAGYRVVQVPILTDVELALAPYPPTEWVVFNLGEGVEGRLFEEARIAWALEAMGYRFTGSDGDAMVLSINKVRGRKALAAAGVPIPPGRFFRHPSEITPESLVGLSFPLIVKPAAEHGSIGIEAESVVYTLSQLRDRVAYVVECYRQAALVEAFIPGREFSVSVWGEPPEVLPPSESDFSALADSHLRILSFSAKWDSRSFEYTHIQSRCPAPITPALRAHLSSLARRAWAAIGCRGYARMDTRLADDGTVYVIEVNTNPDLSPDAGFAIAAQAAGYTYTQMVVRILELALKQKDSCI
ncbi:MAG: ATP-grasp domain-containing protein [Anaerolineae bacterium]|nr:ATP-grasp domain-containing protein [Anaerolineae bacterium]